MEAVPTPIREIKTKEDFLFKGDNITIKLSPCPHNGISIEFVTKEKIKDGMPSFFFAMQGGRVIDDEHWERCVLQTHAHRKWFDKFLRIPIEYRVRERIKLVKKKFVEVQKQDDLAKRIEAKL